MTFAAFISLVFIGTSHHLPYFVANHVDSWTYLAIGGVGLYKVVIVDLCDGTRKLCQRGEVPYFWVILLMVPYLIRQTCAQIHSSSTAMAVVKVCGWALLSLYITFGLLTSAKFFFD